MGTAIAAIFDLDKTILATSSTMTMHGPLRRAGLLSRSDTARSILSQIPYLVWGEGEKRNDRIKTELGRIARGWNLATLNQTIIAATKASMHPQCYVDALDTIAFHKAVGHRIVVASASPQPLVEPIANLLEADFTLATQVGVEDGKLTGEVADFNHGRLKAAAVSRLADKQGWDLEQCWAYSDSISDLPLLELVGHPVAVNPDRALRHIATERDWRIRHFTRTLKLQPSRIALPIMGVVSTNIAVAAITWLACRHVWCHRS